MKQLPRILILGVTFNKNSGSGITLSNLFEDWPEENIAVTTRGVDLDYSGKKYIYYQLGEEEEIRPWPFIYLKQKRKSGSVELGEKIETGESTTLKPKSRSRFYLLLNMLFGKILLFLGLYNHVYQLKASDKFISWAQIFNPDIIYAQASELPMIRFISSVKKVLGKPLIVHIMDDSIKTMNKTGILYFYWKKKTETEFKYLLDSSSLLMSICQGMSDEYKIRYGMDFIPFHNPVDSEKWLPYSKKKYSIKGTFKILYTGRIGEANGDAVMEISKAVEKLYNSGIDIVLDIYTPHYDSSSAQILSEMKSVRVSSNIPHSEVPQLLSSHDLLILPLDFTNRGIKYAKVSMPTKASEYMISGTPIIVYASSETALYNYAKDKGWAFCVGKRGTAALAGAISELYNNQALRQSLGTKAQNIAVENHEAKMVREKFKYHITEALSSIKADTNSSVLV